jgi:hypothetical protein
MFFRITAVIVRKQIALNILSDFCRNCCAALKAHAPSYIFIIFIDGLCPSVVSLTFFKIGCIKRKKNKQRIKCAS